MSQQKQQQEEAQQQLPTDVKIACFYERLRLFLFLNSPLASIEPCFGDSWKWIFSRLLSEI